MKNTEALYISHTIPYLSAIYNKNTRIMNVNSKFNAACIS